MEARSSSREVGIRVPDFFDVVYFSGKPSPKKGERRALLGDLVKTNGGHLLFSFPLIVLLGWVVWW